jgi:hypothetical protein
MQYMKLFRMTALVRLGTLLACSFASNAVAETRRNPNECRVIPGTNFRVTDTPGDAYMFEPVLAVDPRNPRRVFVAATVHGSDVSDVRPYYSSDGGKNWREGERTRERLPTADTGIFYTERFGPILYGNPGDPEPNVISRPERGLQSWRDERLPFPNLDKPTLTESRSQKGRAHRLLFFGMSTDLRDPQADSPRYVLDLFTSEDMITWSRHEVTSSDVVDALLPPESSMHGFNTGNDILQTSNGTLFLPFFRFNLHGGATFWRVDSPDGGMHFGQPIQLLRGAGTPLLSKDASIFPAYAIDQSNGRFHDRIYVLWFEVKEGNVFLMLSHSDDIGLDWSDPLPIDQFARFGHEFGNNSTYYVMPSIEVNKNGVVIMTWYRSKWAGLNDKGRSIISYRRYVTASVDAGRACSPRHRWRRNLARQSGQPVIICRLSRTAMASSTKHG